VESPHEKGFDRKKRDIAAASEREKKRRSWEWKVSLTRGAAVGNLESGEIKRAGDVRGRPSDKKEPSATGEKGVKTPVG